jgi:uncharacterized protein (TIGR02145 family)
MSKTVSKFVLAASIVLAMVLTFSCSSDDGVDSSASVGSVAPSSVKSGTFTDSRDGKTYEWVEIGTQTWMAENLNYAATDSKCGSGDTLSDNNTTTCNTYGRLYDWRTAMNGSASSSENPSGVQGVCPPSWHIPSKAEWDVLMMAVGGSSTAGTKLKATSGWSNNGNGTNDYGFSALPGGRGYITVKSGKLSLNYSGSGYGFWWGASESLSDGAYLRGMSSYAYWSYSNKGYLFSVRCLKD